MIYCKIHVTVVCSILMKNRKIVELSDILSYNKIPTPRDALTPQFQLLSHPPEFFHKFYHDSISENVQCVS
jgi:hypothetical protein